MKPCCVDGLQIAVVCFGYSDLVLKRIVDNDSDN
jgi:hypothetical protein